MENLESTKTKTPWPGKNPAPKLEQNSLPFVQKWHAGRPLNKQDLAEIETRDFVLEHRCCVSAEPHTFEHAVSNGLVRNTSQDAELNDYVERTEFNLRSMEEGRKRFEEETRQIWPKPPTPELAKKKEEASLATRIYRAGKLLFTSFGRGKDIETLSKTLEDAYPQDGEPSYTAAMWQRFANEGGLKSRINDARLKAKRLLEKWDQIDAEDLRIVTEESFSALRKRNREDNAESIAMGGEVRPLMASPEEHAIRISQLRNQLRAAKKEIEQQAVELLDEELRKPFEWAVQELALRYMVLEKSSAAEMGQALVASLWLEALTYLALNFERMWNVYAKGCGGSPRQLLHGIFDPANKSWGRQ